jgi:hypothetical protein
VVREPTGGLVSLYPTLVAELEELTAAELEAVSFRAGVTVPVIEAIVAGRCGASLSVQMRLGYALRRNPLELFALDAELEGALPADRYVSDPATLRVIDGRS